MTVRLSTSRREASRPRPPRTRTPVVDQHATWIAVNPIQGCPKACAYCFLNERGQTAVRPECLASPAKTGDLLAVLAGRQVPNPVVLITKCLIPDDAIDAVTTACGAGLRVIVYVSYSGLGRDIERGIRHEDLKTNFPRLARAGVPVVRYWRSAFPESAATDAMEAVLDCVASYAMCGYPLFHANSCAVEAEVRDRLAARAEAHGRSLGAELRAMLDEMKREVPSR